MWNLHEIIAEGMVETGNIIQFYVHAGDDIKR